MSIITKSRVGGRTCDQLLAVPLVLFLLCHTSIENSGVTINMNYLTYKYVHIAPYCLAISLEFSHCVSNREGEATKTQDVNKSSHL